MEAESAGDAAYGERGDDPHFGELIGDHHGRVAEAKLDLHQPPVWNGHTAALFGVEGPHVPVGGARRVAADEVHCDRVLRTWIVGLCGHGYLPSSDASRRSF